MTRIETAVTGTTDGIPAPVFDWDALLPPVDAPASVSVVRAVDVLADVPEPIRRRIENSLHVTMTRLAEHQKAGKDEKAFAPQWQLQPVRDAAMAGELARLMTRYATYRPVKDIPHYHEGDPAGQITVRRAPVRYIPHDAKPDDKAKVREVFAPEGIAPGFYVRYAAKPLESRNARK